MESLEFRFNTEPAGPCRVRVGSGALDLLLDDLSAAPPAAGFVVVSDSRVAPLHGRPLAEALAARGLGAGLIDFPAGERNKTRETKAAIEDRLFDLQADRDTALIAVGGGVTGDLAGFVAATWGRGVPVIQVPTSLLAMVDAALGGKTAINLPKGKNIVGAFHWPWGVYADVSVLSTLPERHFADGFAEAIKASVIADVALFDRLEAAAPRLLVRDADALAEVVGACLRVKGAVVADDPNDRGRRAMLNFGHTVAHAIEAASGYSVSHGRAVAVGMAVEARVAVSRTGFPEPALERLLSLIRTFGLPTVPPEGIEPDSVLEAARHDKKNRGGQIHCALPLRLGAMPSGNAIHLPVDERLLRDALTAG